MTLFVRVLAKNGKVASAPPIATAGVSCSTIDRAGNEAEVNVSLPDSLRQKKRLHDLLNPVHE
jgi:hypothetical protein